MDILSYAEDRASATLAVLRQAYDDLHERSYKLATVLVAGGGAVGAYALGKLSGGAAPIQWAPLAALSLSWFGVATYVIWQGATSRELSPGNGPDKILKYYEAVIAEPSHADRAIELTRREELRLQQRRITNYADGCTDRARALDRAYKAATLCSLAVPAVVAVACLLLG